MGQDGGGGAAPLHEQIRQAKPFHSRSQEAYLALMRTTDDVKRRYSMLFDRFGITIQQYNVLRILRGAGTDGLPTLTVAERMVERTPGVTRLIDRMERKGWVVRERCSDDRRRVWCKITPTGLGLLGSLDGPIREVDDSLFAALDPGEIDALVETLARIRAHLETH